MGNVENPTTQKLLEVFSQLKKINWHQSSFEEVTFSELKLMFCVKKELEHEPEGIKISEISNSLKVAPPTITQLVNSLEAGGYVLRNLDKTDRRAVRITLTKKGEEIIVRAKVSMLASFDGLVNYLGDEDSTKLAEILEKVCVYFSKSKESN